MPYRMKRRNMCKNESEVLVLRGIVEWVNPTCLSAAETTKGDILLPLLDRGGMTQWVPVSFDNHMQPPHFLCENNHFIL